MNRQAQFLKLFAPAALLLALGCSSLPEGAARASGGSSSGGGPSLGGGGGSAAGGAHAGGGSGGGLALDAGTGGAGSSGCTDEEKLVYLVGSDLGTGQTQLWSFDPAQLKFALVGAMACDGFGSHPPIISGGAVDRSGHAWVSMQSSGLETPMHQGVYEIDIESAACTELPNAQPTYLTGASFSSDAVGSSDEKLFVPYPAFGTLDTASFGLSALGTLGWVPSLYMAALAGNGNGELYALAWFPGATPPSEPNPKFQLHQLDKTNGDVTSSLELDSEAIRYATAWAFATWGGAIWLFVNQSGTGISVTKYELATGAVSSNVASLPTLVVGTAGSSTCAPVAVPK